MVLTAFMLKRPNNSFNLLFLNLVYPLIFALLYGGFISLPKSFFTIKISLNVRTQGQELCKNLNLLEFHANFLLDTSKSSRLLLLSFTGNFPDYT